MRNKKISVCFLQRKPRSVGNYSVEFIFEDVRKRLAAYIDAKVVYSSYESKGVLPRLYNCIEAAFQKADVNHITGDVNYLGIFLSKRRTIHTILDCVHLTSSTGLKHKILKLFWLTLPSKRAAYITAISESTKKEILKFISYPPERIKVIHVAISEAFKRVDKPFNKQQPRILQIGTAPNKNIPRLIEALKGIECKLVIIGKHVREYETMLEANGVRYEYKWGLTEEEIIQEYIKADIVTLASTYEGFGMPILEGQATGRVVVTSNLFSMPEVAGEAAIIVNPYDALSIRNGFLRVINDDGYRHSLIESGFQNIKRFEPNTISNQYLELYNQVRFNSIKN